MTVQSCPKTQELLRSLHIEITADHHRILLSDEARVEAATIFTTPTQLEAAAEQHHMITGEWIDPADAEAELEWEAA